MMRKVVSKIMLFIFMFIQVFTLLPIKSFAGTNSVEVIVLGNRGIIAQGQSSKLNALEALDDVLKSNNIEYVVKDSSYGGKYISKIADLDEGKLGQYTGWMYAVQRDGKYEIPMNSIDLTVLEPNDRLLLYYGGFPKPYIANGIEFSTLSPNKQLTITFNNVGWDGTVNKIEGFKAKIDGKEVDVVENKIVIPSGLNEGVHTLTFYDFKENDDIPNIVADTIKFEIKKPKFKIRVEGLLNTIVKDEANELTVLSGLEDILSKNGISISVKDSQWGKYVEEIAGIKAGRFGGYDGWMYYVKSKDKIETPMVGIDSYVPNEGDEVVVYYGDFNTAYLNTIKFIPEIVEPNKEFKMQFGYTYFDWNENKEVTRTISGAIVTIDDKNYITDKDGLITINGLSKGEHTYKISGYNVDKSPNVVKDEGVFYIDGVKNPSLNYTDDAYSKIVSKNNNLVIKDINKDLSKTLKYIEENQKDMWAFTSLSKMGKGIDKKLIDDACKELLQYGIAEYSNTDIEKLIITLTAAGYSPYNFAGYNLMDELYNKRNLDKFLINDAIFALIALDYTNDKGQYKITREKLIDFILNNAVEVDKNGKKLYGWSLNSSMGINPDLTGVALNSLSPYLSRKDVKVAVDKAVDTLSNMQIDSGYIPDGFGTFSETLSFVILGLTSVGVDVEGVKFTKTNGDLYSALLSFRLENGEFAHEIGKGADYMATEQALRALIAISEFKKTGRYNFYQSNIDASKLKVYEYKNLQQNTNQNKDKKLLPKTGSVYDFNLLFLLALTLILFGAYITLKDKKARR